MLERAVAWHAQWATVCGDDAVCVNADEEELGDEKESSEWNADG